MSYASGDMSTETPQFRDTPEDHSFDNRPPHRGPDTPLTSTFHSDPPIPIGICSDAATPDLPIDAREALVVAKLDFLLQGFAVGLKKQLMDWAEERDEALLRNMEGMLRRSHFPRAGTGMSNVSLSGISSATERLRLPSDATDDPKLANSWSKPPLNEEAAPEPSENSSVEEKMLCERGRRNSWRSTYAETERLTTLKRAQSLATIASPNQWREAFYDAYRRANSTVRAARSNSMLEIGGKVRVTMTNPNTLTHAQGSVKNLVTSQSFNILCGGLIVANALLVGVETEYLTEHQDTLYFFFVAQFVLNIWYLVELVLRLVAYGQTFFTDPSEWRWNLLDFVLVSTSIIEMLTEALDVSGIKMGRILRSVRLCRMLRTLRILRSLRSIRTFRKMIFALTTSMHTLLWSLLLLFFIIYTFAIWFTSGVSDCLYSRLEGCQIDGAERQYVKDTFGTLTRSIYTLYQAISTGYSWAVFVEPLIKMDAYLVALFIFFISLCFFGVLNIVTSVFVESAMLSTQHYKDLMVEEKLRNKEVYAGHMRTIFKQIDVDGSGHISLEELSQFVTDEGLQLKNYFEALELNATDTGTLFKLLDWDGSGSIDIDEFCDGCMRLKGEARSFDINCVMYDVRKMAKKNQAYQKRQDKLLKDLCQRLSGLAFEVANFQAQARPQQLPRLPHLQQLQQQQQQQQPQSQPPTHTQKNQLHSLREPSNSISSPKNSGRKGSFDVSFSWGQDTKDPRVLTEVV